MGSVEDPKVVSRRRFLSASALALGGVALAACGQSDTGSTTTGTDGATTGEGAQSGGDASTGETNLKWSTWGNPGEQERFRQYTDEYNKKNTNVKWELVPVPSDYDAKLLTQLSGGTAPDMFYTGDGFIGKVIANKSVIELTELLKGPDSKSKPEDFFDGLWGAARTDDGKIYGVAVDCNPMVLWYNKKLLQEVGVTTMPADMQKAGEWSWDAYQGILDKLVAAGKRGQILDNWWAPIYAWPTSNGGKLYENKAFVGHEDAKTVEGFQFIYDNLQKKTFTYAGSLPQGQGADAMFMSQQVGFVTAGRWYLPIFKKNTALEYDVVSWPTNTGKPIEPVGIPTAYAVINAKAKNQTEAFKLLTDFVSKEGQIFRLKGGGNAVPSVKGADEVVSEGNLPANWKAFLDTREIGYALWADQASIPGLGDDIGKELDALWLKGGDVKAALDKIAGIAEQKIKAAGG